jgi:hypothetical protein
LFLSLNFQLTTSHEKEWQIIIIFFAFIKHHSSDKSCHEITSHSHNMTKSNRDKRLRVHHLILQGQAALM